MLLASLNSAKPARFPHTASWRVLSTLLPEAWHRLGLSLSCIHSRDRFLSIHWQIIRSLARRPFKVVYTDDVRSYRGIDVLIGALHVAEHVQRVSTAKTVAIMLPTSGAFPIAALGVWMLGRVAVPLNYLLSKDELQYVVDDCQADTVISASPMLDHLKDSAPRVQTMLRMDSFNFRSVPDVRWPALTPDEHLGVLLYTSGTSGRPKGVMLSHANIVANIQQIQTHVGFGPGEVLLGVLPQFHSFGLTVLTLLPAMVGARSVFTARFVPGKIMALIREHRPTTMIAIPSMYNALLHAKSATAEDFASFRYIVSGGEPLPAAVFDGFRERFGITLNEGYGLTETSPVSNWCRPDEWRPHSVGRPLPGMIQRIVDMDTGRVLPPERDGEVRMQGPNVMQGYFKLPDETAKAFDDEGFFRTGDIGRFDYDGHLFITGRLKEMLIVGGENVFPREIEEVLNQHPSVKDSGVVGKPDPMRGELPVAFVELKDDAAFDEKAIITHCRQHLAGYKVPGEIRRLDALPRNPTGKVMRRELKKLIFQSVSP